MKTYLQIAFFTLVVSLTYTFIGRSLPQFENHPPAVVELGANIGPEDLSAAGSGVFEGVCASCHKIGEAVRAPDLSNIGALAAARAAERSAASGETYTAIDYLVESLCEPNAYMAPGFGAGGMPGQGGQLSGGQILATVAYLQDQGDVATVRGTDVDPVERFCGISEGGDGAAAAPAGPEPVGGPEAVFAEFACAGCHQMTPGIPSMGPNLSDIGSRMSKAEIYEALLEPAATVDEAYAAFGTLMPMTLDGNGFYDRMTAADYRALVDWLAAKTGE
ncbi:MAG: c-type cytochrome [Myxococcota bacterium]|nr:c-type cytochrome [Myxococcota bacterium]